MASDQKKPIIPAKQEPFSDADWTWLNGNPAHERDILGHEILHSGDPSGRELCLRFQPSD